MAKKETENKKAKSSKSPRNEKKELRKDILKEKLEVEEKIDRLVEEKKATKDKARKKELKKEIKNEKIKLSRIGKKDTFLSDVRAEMRLVRWPSAKEVFKYSVACLIFVAFFALFFYGIDFLFALVKDLID